MITKDSKKEVYRARLLELREKLVRTARGISEANLNNSREAGEEFADVGSDNFIRETRLSILTEEGQKLIKIERALQRLEDGSYGICIDTGKKIQEKRLEAMPYALRCVEAQGEYERKLKMGIMPSCSLTDY